MATAKANWKGFIKFGEVAFAVGLYTAASSSERIAFNTLNRATGNRREFVDSETGDPVEREEQVKGYEIKNGDYVVLEPEEVAAAIPYSDKTLKIEAFMPNRRSFRCSSTCCVVSHRCRWTDEGGSAQMSLSFVARAVAWARLPASSAFRALFRWKFTVANDMPEVVPEIRTGS